MLVESLFRLPFSLPLSLLCVPDSIPLYGSYFSAFARIHSRLTQKHVLSLFFAYPRFFFGACPFCFQPLDLHIVSNMFTPISNGQQPDYPSPTPLTLQRVCPTRVHVCPSAPLFSRQGCDAKLREEGGKPYVTDNDNYIVDLYFTEPIKDANQAGKEVMIEIKRWR